MSIPNLYLTLLVLNALVTFYCQRPQGMAIALNPLLNLYSRALGSIITTTSVNVLLCPHRLPSAISLPNKVPCQHHLPSHAEPDLLFLRRYPSSLCFWIWSPPIPHPGRLGVFLSYTRGLWLLCGIPSSSSEGSAIIRHPGPVWALIRKYLLRAGSWYIHWIKA